MTVVYCVWTIMKLENDANHDVEGRRVHPGRDQGGRGHQGCGGRYKILWSLYLVFVVCTSLFWDVYFVMDTL